MSDSGRRGRMLLWLLVCAVLLGLITMHHVVSQRGERGEAAAVSQQITATHADFEPGSMSAPPDGGSILGHLCFAVLVGSIIFLIGFRLVRRLRDAAAELSSLTARTRSERAPPSAPLPATTGFAYDLCVLRL